MCPLRESVSSTASHAVWPGRLETIPASLSFPRRSAQRGKLALSEFLGEFHPKGLRMIFACMRDKKYEEMLEL